MGEHSKGPFRDLGQFLAWCAAALIAQPTETRGTHPQTGDVLRRAQQWHGGWSLAREHKRRLSYWGGVVLILVAFVLLAIFGIADFLASSHASVPVRWYWHVSALATLGLGVYLTVFMSDRYDPR